MMAREGTTAGRDQILVARSFPEIFRRRDIR
jgi:hypothetical protein